MGSAASAQLQNELQKPLNASDLSEADAKAEVIHLRNLLRQHEKALVAFEGDSGLPRVDTGVGRRHSSIKSPHSRADVSRYDDHNAKNFKLDDAPHLKDYLVNEYYRFCGEDEVLEWDEFWRFMKDLDLGLDDAAIVQMRQKADVNADGVVDWDEMVAVVEPVLGKYWRAELEGAPEYFHWAELHWETHFTVGKTTDGYVRKGEPFWVNKLTGENSWVKPSILERHDSLEENKKARSMASAPSLEAVLRLAFENTTKEKKSGLQSESLSHEEFWAVLTGALEVNPPLSPQELTKLTTAADVDSDGRIDWKEFVASLAPVLAGVFKERNGANPWVALTAFHEDGHEYIYWYNRVTGESTWENPKSKK